jgi:hypothetical protein
MSEGELPPLDPEVRALIDAAHEAHDPAPAQRARTFAALQAKVAAGAVGGTGVAMGWVSSAKAAVVMLGGVGAIVAAAVWGTPQGETARPREAATRAAAARQGRPAATPSSQPPVRSEGHAAPVVTSEVTKAARTKERTLLSLDGETALLRAANGALNRGDAARALKLLAQYDRRFPTGALREERSATEVVALCSEGRSAEARALSRAFVARYPHSPLLPRVTKACAADAAAKSAP